MDHKQLWLRTWPTSGLRSTADVARNWSFGHACCAAQMFLNEGDGVVFRGANGPWKTGDYDYHLKAPAAKNLLTLVLNTYAETHGRREDSQCGLRVAPPCARILDRVDGNDWRVSFQWKPSWMCLAHECLPTASPITSACNAQCRVSPIRKFLWGGLSRQAEQN